MNLKPARPGLVVRDPVSMTPLPAEGKSVVLDSYWRRRLKAGDVVEATTAKSAKAKE